MEENVWSASDGPVRTRKRQANLWAEVPLRRTFKSGLAVQLMRSVLVAHDLQLCTSSESTSAFKSRYPSFWSDSWLMGHQDGETRLAISTQCGMPLMSNLHWGALSGAGSLYQVSSMACSSSCPVCFLPFPFTGVIPTYILHS